MALLDRGEMKTPDRREISERESLSPPLTDQHEKHVIDYFRGFALEKSFRQ